jgi:hypothetical protein
MNKIFGSAVAAALLLASPLSASAGELKLTLNNGRATLIAEDVPLRQILAEWARIGKTTIVNGDKLTTSVTLRLEDMPERQVLEVLLRSASGYIVAARPEMLAEASAFDRILIMPTSRAPAATAANTAPQPFNSRPPAPMPIQPDVDDDPPVEPVVPQGMPQPGMPQAQPGMPTNQPGSQSVPQTLPRPGMPPAPAGQPNPYGTPPLPPGVRPPGGGGGGA